MASKIPWCDETINPVVGCCKCSPGCDNCYAEAMAHRLVHIPQTAAKYAGVVDDAGRWTGKINIADVQRCFSKISKIKKPKSIFLGSMCDLFHENLNEYLIKGIIYNISRIPHHNFLLLTKRPERMSQIMNSLGSDYSDLLHVWFGATVCNQKEADEKIPLLTKTLVPMAHRFVSIEPMLGEINLRFGDSDHSPTDNEPFQERHHLIRGVIVGGETGPGARPMNLDWVRSVRDQCAEAGVPFFFKGWGKGYLFSSDADGHENKHNSLRRVDEGNIGRLLDGVEHNELPWGVNQ